MLQCLMVKHPYPFIFFGFSEGWFKFVSNTLLCVGVWFKLLAFMIVVLVQSFFWIVDVRSLYRDDRKIIHPLLSAKRRVVTLTLIVRSAAISPHWKALYPFEVQSFQEEHVKSVTGCPVLCK